MNRRGFIRTLGGAGLAVTAGRGVRAKLPRRSATARRNIIMLLTDDQRYDDLGCTGNPILRTPHIDSLARRGVLFCSSFVTSSICMASRASYFTGRVERRHACNFYYRNLADTLWQESYPVLLRAAGYHTGFIGKFGVRVDGYPSGLPASDFDSFNGFGGQGDYFPEDEDGPHMTGIMADQAIRFLRNCGESDKPFCLSISFKAPHLPLAPDPAYTSWYDDLEPAENPNVRFEELAGLPPAYGEAAWYPRLIYRQHFTTRQDRSQFIAQRYRLIAGLDAAVGRILAELDKLGLADDTAIIFASDNGYYYGEHGLATKFYMHEESIRVPLIVFDPQLPSSRRGAKVQELVANVDVAPTICRLAGLTPPDGMQGRSVLPLLRGDCVDWRKVVFCESIVKERRPMCDAIRTKRWKYIQLFEQDPVQEELYELEKDPYELRNLAAIPQCEDTLTALREALQELRVAYSGDPTGFPSWIRTQRENTANWQGYRKRYLNLVDAKNEVVGP